MGTQPSVPHKRTSGIAARGGATVLLSQSIKLVLQFVSTVVLARLLAPEVFGLMAMVLAITTLAEVLRDFGLSTAVLNAKKITFSQQSNLFWINTGIGIVCTLALVILAPVLGKIYNEPAVVNVAIGVAIVFTLNGMATQFIASINRQLRFTTLMSVDLIPQLVAISLAVVLAIFDFGVWALVAQQIVLALSTLLMSWAFSGWHPKRPSRKTPVKEFVVAGTHIAGTRMFAVLAQNAPNVGIGIALGATNLGVFNRAYQLFQMPLNQINAPLTRVALPLLSKISDSDLRYNRAIRKSQTVALYLTSTLFLLMAGLAQPITAVLLGPGWEAAGPVLAALCLGGAFRAVSQITFWVFVSRNLTKEQLKFSAVTQPLIAAVTILGLFWGINGVAIAHSIAYAIVWISGLLYVGRLSNIPSRVLALDTMRTLLLCGAPMAVLGFGATQFFSNHLVSILLTFTLGAVYFVFVFLISRTIRNDICYLFSAFRTLALKRRK